MQWQFDPSHTSVEASAKHMGFTTVRVRFPGATGEVVLDPRRPEAGSVNVEIPVASLSSGDERRDAHLRSADFFDAENAPAIAFRSTSVRPLGGQVYAVAGELTMRGTTKPATIQVTLQGFADDSSDPSGRRAFVEATTTIDRREWGLVWNMPVPQGLLVSNDIRIEVAAQLVAAAALSRAA
jgi:polyisoprenoid-binding protein YceI